MYEEIITLAGEEEGPTSMILAGVHGNERCGIEAVQNLLPKLDIKKGSVLIAYGNPLAIEQGVRFVDSNLNRLFKSSESLSEKERSSYEYDRAQVLKKYIERSDALLDVHASLTPDSRPFLICEENTKGISDYLPIDLVVSGFDEIQPGGSDYYMNWLGGKGICVECGFAGDPRSVRTAEECILAFLKVRGHISGDLDQLKQSVLRMNSLYLTKTDRFTLSKPWKDFENVLPGEVIGRDGDEDIKAEKESVILFARNRDRAGDEAFLLGEQVKSLE